MTVISDDAGEFGKAVEGSQLARGRILDWFHIAMKFKAAKRSVFGSKMIDSLDRESVETEIDHAKWLVWHGKGSKAVGRHQGTGRVGCWRGKDTNSRRCSGTCAPCAATSRNNAQHVGQLQRPASQGPADQQQHRRVRGESGRQPPHGQEANRCAGLTKGRTAWRRSESRF